MLGSAQNRFTQWNILYRCFQVYNDKKNSKTLSE